MDKIERIGHILGAVGVIITTLIPVVSAIIGILVKDGIIKANKVAGVNKALQAGGDIVRTLAEQGMSIKEAKDNPNIPLVPKDTKI